MSDVAVPTNGNGGYTSKEMLVRIDTKVDGLSTAVAAKHAFYDVELALLKARADGQGEHLKDLERQHNEQVRALEEEVDETKARQESILARINVAAGAVALIVFLSPILWILANKYIGT